MDQTARLKLPFLFAEQAQKHITHNDALQTLDTAVQASALSAALALPPATPAEGDVYLVAAGASGAFTGKEQMLAQWSQGAWLFVGPQEGWRVYDQASGTVLVFAAGNWSPLTDRGGAGLDRFGINTDADTYNRLALSSDASLFTHAGAGHQLKLNKAASTDTASVLFQTNWSGRAEFGMSGDDNWRVKVSADGATWNEALMVEAASGAVQLPKGQLRFPATPNPSADPNTLDGYEEGSFVPRLVFGGSDAGMVYVNQSGRYTKIGRVGVFSLLLEFSARGTALGSAAITGLPFSVDANFPGVVATSFYSGLAGMTGALVGTTSGTSIALSQTGTSNTSALSEANFGQTATIRLSGVF